MELKNYIELKCIADYITGFCDALPTDDKAAIVGISCAVERINEILSTELPWQLDK